MVAEGDPVTYSGPFECGAVSGDEGVVLSLSVGCGHVMWRTGTRRGLVDVVDPQHLVALLEPGLLDDSLDVPRVAVRDVYESQGESGLFAALSEAGVLSGLPQIAEDLLAMASARVRSDLHSVLDQLDPEDAAAVVGLATTACMREALSGG